MTLRKRDYHDHCYQWLSPRRLLCLLCAKVISTNGRGKAMHEKGIEHRSAMEELTGRKAG